MKIAQCKYTKSGMEGTLHAYFDSKAFDFILPAMSKEQEDDFIRTTCDSIAASMPHDNNEKHFYIKRIYKPDASDTLKVLCTDGFLIDDALTVPISHQAFANERIKITASDQLPLRFKISNDLLTLINDRLPLFEQEAKKAQSGKKIATSKEYAKQNQPAYIAQEFTADKSFDVFKELTRIKKEMKILTENTLKTMQHEIAKESKVDSHDVEVEKRKDTLVKKLNLISTSYEKLSSETDDISERVNKEVTKLITFKKYVIDALYEAAKEFSQPILSKIQNAPLHIIKPLQTDFNKKFSGIAKISESAELSSLQEAEQNLGKLSLEDLQDIISNESKENPGLLQKCNTSWTEESPELKIVMKQLNKLNEKLMSIFKDEPKYANQAMVIITRIPVPRSFQFKFSNHALGYKKVVDDFCKTQKDALMRLVNQYQKILQINNMSDTVLPSIDSLILANIVHEKSSDLQKLKDTTDTILAMATKDHNTTEKYKTNSQKIYNSLLTNIDSNLKSLTSNIHFSMQKIQDDIKDANTISQQIITTKSKIDIQINHHLLHPDIIPDLEELDMKVKALREQLNQLFAKNKLIQEEQNRLASYEMIINRANEIDLSTEKANVLKQRNEAKSFLLQTMQAQQSSPLAQEKTKKQILAQYTKVDVTASEIDKIMNELIAIKKAIFTDLDTHTELSTENLELKFHTISEKMQILTDAINVMNGNVTTLKKLMQQSQ